MAAGDFTPSVIPALKLRLKQMFDQDRHSKEFIADVDALKVIIANQTAKLEVLESTKKNQVEVSWIDASSVKGTAAIAESCAISGVLLETKKQAYDLTLSRQATPFKVHEFVFRDNIFGQNDMVERGLAMQVKELDNYVAQSAISKLATFGGQNKDTSGELGADMTIQPTVTYINPTKWNHELMVYFQLMALMNRFGSVYLLHGMNYWQLAQLATAKTLNSDEKDILALLQRFNHNWDPLNFVKLGIGNTSFMIEGNSIAFGSRNYFGGVDKPEANTMLFSVPSGTIPGLSYDVTMRRGCEVLTGEPQRDFFVSYEMCIPKFDLLQNPVNGVAGDTGVIKLIKGVAA